MNSTPKSSISTPFIVAAMQMPQAFAYKSRHLPLSSQHRLQQEHETLVSPVTVSARQSAEIGIREEHNPLGTSPVRSLFANLTDSVDEIICE